MFAGYDIVSHALDGSGLRRLTETPGYDAEATLSPDGRKLVFTGNRRGKVPGETNLFVVDWVE